MERHFIDFSEHAQGADVAKEEPLQKELDFSSSPKLFQNTQPDTLVFTGIDLKEEDANPNESYSIVSTPVVYQVHELVHSANLLLEQEFLRIFVEGEIDGFKQYAKHGHCYFTLKDRKASLSVMLPGFRASRVKFKMENGMVVRIVGKLGLYEPQGRFQLYADEVLLTGEGEQKQALEELKKKLQAEGLFLQEKKRPLPFLPRRVGIATSLSGAVLRDILKVAYRRGIAHFILAPCSVQGINAVQEICRAIERLQKEVDVIIVARGGGSSIDLSAFQEESVVRAVAASQVPIVSAVGHEVDYTLCDLAADVRAPTPSAAAEVVIPLFEELRFCIHDYKQRLGKALLRRLLTEQQRVDLLTTRLGSKFEQYVNQKKQILQKSQQSLLKAHPHTKIVWIHSELRLLHEQLIRSTGQLLQKRKEIFGWWMSKLEALSPLAVLTRGYAIATDHEGHILHNASEAEVGEIIHIQLSQGILKARVEGE